MPFLEEKGCDTSLSSTLLQSVLSTKHPQEMGHLQLCRVPGINLPTMSPHCHPNVQECSHHSLKSGQPNPRQVVWKALTGGKIQSWCVMSPVTRSHHRCHPQLRSVSSLELCKRLRCWSHINLLFAQWRSSLCEQKEAVTAA